MSRYRFYNFIFVYFVSIFQFGVITDAMKAAGLWNNTLMIVSSDNGGITETRGCLRLFLGYVLAKDGDCNTTLADPELLGECFIYCREVVLLLVTFLRGDLISL